MFVKYLVASKVSWGKSTGTSWLDPFPVWYVMRLVLMSKSFVASS